jgi:hypothetical protein
VALKREPFLGSGALEPVSGRPAQRSLCEDAARQATDEIIEHNVYSLKAEQPDGGDGMAAPQARQAIIPGGDAAVDGPEVVSVRAVAHDVPVPAALKNFLAGLGPVVKNPLPHHAETCLYTNTADVTPLDLQAARLPPVGRAA